MLCSHSPSSTRAARQTTAMMAARMPEMAQPMMPTTARTSQNGEVTRTFSSGLRM